MENTTKCTTIYAALAKAQAKFKTVIKNCHGYGYDYADISSIMEAVRPALNENGLYVYQKVTSTDGMSVTCETFIANENGEVISSGPLTINAMAQKGMNQAQALGSAQTYARRYSLSSFLGIASESDDDGNGAGPKNTGDQPQGRTGAPPKPNGGVSVDLINAAEDAVKAGVQAYQDFFSGLSSAAKKELTLSGYHREFKHRLGLA